jgi:hypothetical protein
MITSRTTFFMVTLLAATVSLGNAQRVPVTVCRMLDAMSDHEELTVRGEIIGESHHGFFLSEGINGDPCPGWRRRFLTAPSVVGLQFVSSHGVQLTKEQEQSNRTFLERLITLGQPVKRRVTVTGVAVKNPGSLIFRRADGSYLSTTMDPYWIPTEFVIKSIREEGGTPP